MINHSTLKLALLAIVLTLLPAVSQAQQSVDAEEVAPGGQTFVAAVRLLATSSDPERQARALSLLMSAVETGHPDAMFVLGTLYAKGQLVDRDQTKARALYRGAAERNHNKSRNALAMMLLEDAGGAGDAEAAALLQKAAGNGLVAAKANLGVLYIEGRGVARHPEKGAGLIREAAEAGLPRAQHNYARLLEAGNGVQANPEEAAKWYGQAAGNGVPEAQFNLGLMMARAARTEADLVDAMKWLMIAATGSRGELNRQVKDAVRKLASALEPPQVADAGEKANIWLVRYRMQGPGAGGGGE